jgi:TIR domain
MNTKGRNLFESRGVKTASSKPEIAVFISHSRLDKCEARKVASYLIKCGIDVYFDEKDAALQLADANDDHLNVVRCIEDGLSNCTHLLGIITENTKKSWWVPYEIGGATGRQRACAHLIDGQVKNLPSYVKAATILADRGALTDWLSNIPIKKTARVETIIERLNRTINFSTAESMELDFLPAKRAGSDITYTMQ